MKQTKREKAILIFLYTVIVVLLTINATYYCIENGINIFKPVTFKKHSNASYKELNRELKKVRKVLDEKYVDSNRDEKALIEGAIKGYVSGLGDKYTEYYTKKEWEDINTRVSGEYKGIGVVLSLNDNEEAIITQVMKDAPAEKAGLLPEDKIMQIDNHVISNNTLDEIADKLKGKENTIVKLKISRIENNKNVIKDIDVKREDIKINNTSFKMLKNNVGYIRIDTFDEHVHENFEKAYTELKQKGMKKLIIDVRYNGGGDLRSTQKILELILPKNTLIFKTEDKYHNIEEVRTKKDPKISEEIIVLGNKYSASASEILISALIDNNRAKFVGEKTFGKGVIQTIIPFKLETGILKGGVLKVTTEEYKRANGEKINKIGIKPQIEVKLTKDNLQQKKDVQLEKAEKILGGKNE